MTLFNNQNSKFIFLVTAFFLVCFLVHGLFENYISQLPTVFPVNNLRETKVFSKNPRRDADNEPLASMIKQITLSHNVSHNIETADYSCNGSATFHGVEDLLCQQPPTFLEKYMNPCWRRRGKFVCLPYFQLIGVGKCGTTDLFARILKHPRILHNEGYLQKETFWWSCKRYGHFIDRPHKIENFSRYLEYFSSASKTIHMRPNDNFITDTCGCQTVKNKTSHRVYDAAADLDIHCLQYNKVPGDVVPDQDLIVCNVAYGGERVEMNFTWSHSKWDGNPRDIHCMGGWVHIPQNQGLQEPRFITPHLIKHMNPNVKLIVLLRDPVDRQYSDFFHRRKGNLTASGFDTAVRHSIAVLHNCTLNASLRWCLYNRDLQLRVTTRIHMGFYYMFLKDWLDVFPRHQVLIFRNEDYKEDTNEYMQRIFQFLRVRNLTQTEMEKVSTAARKRITKGKAEAGPMQDSTRRILKDLYQPFNKKLAELLKDDKYLWSD